VIDPFRAPTGPYGAGNRGLEYDTVPGEVARAVADGVVAFAGPVAGRLVVSIDHADGLRSSLTGLATLVVATGGAVRQGAVLGAVADRLHLGIRRGDTYLDPAALFAVSTPSGAVRLVPTDGPLGAAPAVPSVPGPTHGFDAARRGRRVLAVVACPPACKPGERG
jgi:murein DD-endopeptidase MepM/ murein hydrolase activator NlpD